MHCFTVDAVHAVLSISGLVNDVLRESSHVGDRLIDSLNYCGLCIISTSDVFSMLLYCCVCYLVIG